MELRVIDEEWVDKPYFNLAVEEAIARSVDRTSPNTIRFWRNANAVIIGRFQCPILEVDIKNCQKFNTRVFRRFTGGGAVYHDLGNLNYAVSIKKDFIDIENIFQLFEIVGETVSRGLNALSVKAKFSPLNDIEVNGRKISGMAGTVLPNCFFVHGSILVNTNLDVMEKVLNVPSEKLEGRGIRSIRKRVSNIVDFNGEISINEVKRVLKDCFEETFSTNSETGKLSEEEIEYAKKLYKEKYLNYKWNFEPCLECNRLKTEVEDLLSLMGVG